jgi:autotransporter-associated beta strand protein
LLIAALWCVLAMSATAAAPDLTSIPQPVVNSSLNYNLGATGARGWIYSNGALLTSESRQILITQVDSGSPAAGILAVGDVILGASGTPANPVSFTADARVSLANAITAAEESAHGGALKVLCWRSGVTTTQTLTLEVMGSYSATAPYNCPKSTRILQQAAAYIAARSEFGRYSFGALALLASGDSTYGTTVQTQARALIPSAATRTSMMSDDPQGSVWERGYVGLFLTEYYLATGDAQVLPAIEAYAVNIAKGGSHYGTYGHGYASKSNDGSLHGSIAPYGPVNSAGLPCFLAMVLAKKCGISHPEVDAAITRSSNFYAYYVGKGGIPYGEHVPVPEHEDNGKTALAAVAFTAQGGQAPAARFFAKMSTAGQYGRGWGHTGPFFSFLWAALGANCGGQDAGAAYFQQVRWHLELARRWDGSFAYDPNGGGNAGTYNSFSTTAAYLLTYATPLRKLWITGKSPDPAHTLGSTEVAEAVASGTYDETSRTTAQLVLDLGSWSPRDRDRAAKELAKRSAETAALVPNLILMVQGTHAAQRVGACQALGLIKDARALDVLVAALTDPDRHLRLVAGNAMTAMGETARPRLNAMLSALAANEQAPQPPAWDDPIQLGNGRLAFTLFYPGGAYGGESLLAKGITGVDRSLLYPAIRTLAKNPDGQARGCLRGVFDLLTFEDLLALAPDIVHAAKYLSEANTMFGKGIRIAADDLFARFRIAEGVPLTKIVDSQEGVGDGYTALESLKVFQSYGGGVRLVTPDPKVRQYIVDGLDKWIAQNWTDQINASYATLAVIDADLNPAPLYSFKTLNAIVASPAAITLPTRTTTLSASVTDLADDGELVYTWTKVRGAGTVAFSRNGTTASATTTATFGSPGTYQVQMTAYDGLTSVSGVVEVVVNDTNGQLPPNNPPQAISQSVTTAENEPLAITLTGLDPEGHPLYYSVTTSPTWGTLSGTAPNLTYQPVALFYGADSFGFQVMDSEGLVASQTISITVTAASHQALLTESFDYTPSGPNGLNGRTGGTGFAAGSHWSADSNNETATRGFDILDGAGAGTGGIAPWNGVLQSVPQTGKFAGSALYANAPDHLWAYRGLGPAATTAIANKQTLWLSCAIAATHFYNTASIAIGAAELLEDRGSIAAGQAIGIGNGTSGGFGAAYWKDENGTPTSGDRHEVHSTGASFAFNSATATTTTPYVLVAKIEWDADNGKDRVSIYRFTDGPPILRSTFDQGAVSISADLDQATFDTLSLAGSRFQVDEIRLGTSFADVVTAGASDNRPPLTTDQSVVTRSNISVPLTLTAMDPDGDVLTYSIADNPLHGTLSGTVPNLIYQPAAGFSGLDRFTFIAHDGDLDSTPATVSIAVSFANPAGFVTWDNTPGNGGINGGSGTWDLSNSYWTIDAGLHNQLWLNATGDTAIFGGTAGTVTLTTGVSVGGLTFNDHAGYRLAGSGELVFGTSGAITTNVDAEIAAVITGASAITKTGSGTLTLSGSNTFSDRLSVEQGTLKVASLNHANSAGVLGMSGLAVILGKSGGGSATLQYTGPSLTSTKKFTLASGSMFQVDMPATILTLAGALDGSGALGKSGPGTLDLSGSSMLGGAATVSGGTLAISGGSLTCGAATTVNGGAALSLSDGGVLSDLQTYIGDTSNNNAVTVTGSGSKLLRGTGAGTGTHRLYLGMQSAGGNGGSGNSLTISNGGYVYSGGDNSNRSILNSSNNTVTVTGAGSQWYITGNNLYLGSNANSANNSILVTSGGTLTMNGAQIVMIGAQTGCAGNSITVTGAGSSWALGNGQINLGSAGTTTGSGGTQPGSSNSLRVVSSGVLSNLNWLMVGNSSAAANNNTVLVQTGGLLEVNTGIVAGSASATGNTVTVDTGGILQFKSATPTLTIAAGNSITLNGATLSYKGLTNPGLLESNNGGAGTVGAFIWSGSNCFRLNGSSDTGSNTYTFGNHLGARNYTALELLGSAALTRAITLDGSHGATLLLDGATATVGGGITLGGPVSITASGAASILSGVISGSGELIKAGSGALTLKSLNTYNGDTIVSAGTLKLTYANSNNEAAAVTIAATGATLELGFTGTDTVAKLFIGTTQLPAGVYKASGNPGAGTAIAQLAGTGTLTVTSGASGSFGAWAAGFTSPALSNIEADADPDHDGLSNALEYVFGSDPRLSNQDGTSSSVVGSNLIFTFKRSDAAETADVALLVQVSTDLVDWTTWPGYSVGATSAVSTPGVDVNEAGPDNTDLITVTIPKGAAAVKVARLKVTVTP